MSYQQAFRPDLELSAQLPLGRIDLVGIRVEDPERTLIRSHSVVTLGSHSVEQHDQILARLAKLGSRVPNS